MKQIESHVILIILFLLLGPIPGAALESKGHADRHIMERMSFGKMWYVYIKANVFDIIVHTFRIRTKDSNAMSMSLYGAVKQMGRFKMSRYPCQRLNISVIYSILYDLIGKKGLPSQNFGIGLQSRICGSISRSFWPSAFRLERDDKDLTWLWQIHVNQHFIVNVTFLSFESRFYPPCITRRALIQETRGIDLSQKRTLGVFCPNNPPQSFYSSGNNVEINIHTWNIYEDIFSKTYHFHQWLGTISFTYEILDNDLSLDPWKLLEKRWPSGKYEYFRHYSELSSLFVRVLPSFHLSESFNRTSPYLFQFFESNGNIVFIFYFRSFLGATIAIREGSLTCTNTQTTLVAYEGPMVDITRIESLLVRLQEWNCGHYMKATNGEEELKGRIGDMTILFIVDKATTAYFYSLILKVAYSMIYTNLSYALNKYYFLDNGTSFSFEPKRTYLYKLKILTVRTGFVNIYFDHISLKGYMDQTCTYGGLYFENDADVYNGDTVFVGALCSQKSATRFQRLYGRHGLTFNDYVIIYIKQYYLLFRAHVKLRFSRDQCLGLINLRMRSNFVNYYPAKKGYVKLIRDLVMFYAQGYNFYYRWFGGYNSVIDGLSSVGVKRMNGIACYKVNYVNFDTISDVVDGVYDEWWDLMDVKTVVGTRNEEDIRPTLMSMAFWNMDEELKHFDFDKCLANAFRFYPDNQNNEPYILLRAPEEDLWATLAFTGKFALDKTCLIFGGAYHFRVQEEAGGHSQCFSEVGGYLYDAKYPILPKGVCGGFLLNLYRGYFSKVVLSFQRPLNPARCCYLNILVMSKSIPGIRLFRAKRKTPLQAVEVLEVYEWSNRITATSEMFTWRALCTMNSAFSSVWIPGKGFTSSLLETCIDVDFFVCHTCDVNIHYRMSLLALPYKTIMTERMFSRWRCHGHSCYIARIMDYPVSWDGAQAECIKLNGTLVAVNSDAEWRYLTYNIILQRKSYIEWIYIGYRSVSNII